MFDDLTLEELRQLRADVRDAMVQIAIGQAVAEIKYSDMGRKFHPASADQCERFLSQITNEIQRRDGNTGPLIAIRG